MKWDANSNIFLKIPTIRNVDCNGWISGNDEKNDKFIKKAFLEFNGFS